MKFGGNRESRKRKAHSYDDSAEADTERLRSKGSRIESENDKGDEPEGRESTQEILEQQRIRIEQLEKELRDTRIEIERLRLYNRQLALGLTSIHKDSTKPTSSTLSSLLPLYQPDGTDRRMTSVFHSNWFSGEGTNNIGLQVSSNDSSRLAEGSLEATSKTERKTQSRYWTPDEHKRFLEGLARFGHKDMKAIARFVGTRSPTQVRTHAQKYYLKLAREAAKRQTNQYYRVDSSNLALASGTNPRKTDEYYATKSASESLSGTKAMNDDISDSANENFVFSDRIFNSTSLYMTNLDQDSNFGEAIANSEGILEWMNSDT